ncbi:hypothetical protein HAR83_003231 [Vibrio metschnikovii]|nr:hypothetical protein [Vibrio metschnikovii]
MIKEFPKPIQNMLWTGLIFMFTAKVQGTMTDLIISKKNPDLKKKFVATPKIVPRDYLKKRVEYWEKQFGSVKNEFVEIFSEELSSEEVRRITKIHHLRNMIAHAHVSDGRDYMMYRPHGGEKLEQKLIEDLGIQLSDEAAEPMLLKIEFWKEEEFQVVSNLISSITEDTFVRLANNLGIPIGQIS